MKSFSSREFNQDVSQAKRFAVHEPVFVTDRGKPTHVLVSMDEYRRLVSKPETLVEMLSAPHPIDAEPDWRSLSPWTRRG